MFFDEPFAQDRKKVDLLDIFLSLPAEKLAENRARGSRMPPLPRSWLFVHMQRLGQKAHALTDRRPIHAGKVMADLGHDIQLCRHAGSLQRLTHRFGADDRHEIIVFAVKEEHRRIIVGDECPRRGEPIEISDLPARASQPKGKLRRIDIHDPKVTRYAPCRYRLQTRTGSGLRVVDSLEAIVGVRGAQQRDQLCPG